MCDLANTFVNGCNLLVGKAKTALPEAPSVCKLHPLRGVLAYSFSDDIVSKNRRIPSFVINGGTEIMQSLRIVFGALILVLAGTAQAATTTPYSHQQAVFRGVNLTDTFTVWETGTYRAEILDLAPFAQPGTLGRFDPLILAIFRGNPSARPVGVAATSPAAGAYGQFTFQGVENQTFGVRIVGLTDGVGAFAARVSLVPIPIPAAGLLFISAMLGLTVVGRRKRSRAKTAALA